MQTPANENLVWFYLVLLADTQQRLVVCFLVSHERAVCFNDDVVLLTILDDFTLLTPWVKLDELVLSFHLAHVIHTSI